MHSQQSNQIFAIIKLCFYNINMKKFKFPLQSLLEYREKLELEQKNKLIKAAAEYQHIVKNQQDSLDFVNKERAEIFSKGEPDMDALRNLDRMQSNSAVYVRSLQEEADQKKAAMEEEREKYNKAHQEKLVIEKLRAQEYSKYKKSRELQENNDMDEISKHFTPDKFD